MNLVICIYLFMLGTIFASAIACLAGRLVAGENWVKGKSHCEFCNHELGFFDLIPILSYLYLRGRCRYCHHKLPIRYLLTEILLGSVFVVTFLSRPILDFKLVQNLILFTILFGLSLVDLDSYIIPDGFIVAGILNWIVGQFFENTLLKGLIGFFVLGGGILLISLLMDKILGKESLGGGDVKLLAMLGLYTGAGVGVLLLFLSSIIGLLFVICFKNKKIPFGPAISIAAFFVILWGDYFWNWYITLL